MQSDPKTIDLKAGRMRECDISFLEEVSRLSGIEIMRVMNQREPGSGCKIQQIAVNAFFGQSFEKSCIMRWRS